MPRPFQPKISWPKQRLKFSLINLSFIIASHAPFHIDQGRVFESSVIKELCNIAEVEKSRTTPYHPVGNGMVERFKYTLLNMLGTLRDDQKQDWKAYGAPLVYSYIATRHDSAIFFSTLLDVW